MATDLRHPYLSRHLIAYIGNKRRLLPLLHAAIETAWGAGGRGATFLDLFAGSGSVSRLARLMGFRVICNDWEEFARVINTAHVATNAAEADPLFGPEGGLDAVLSRLNALAGPPADGEYVARYYAPQDDDTDAADYRHERLFYTRSNALAIDRIRAEIERLCPPGPSEAADRRRALLLGPLLYEASTHANTSGVFKAYHKGFGGHGRDALGRILAPISLERPVLIDAPQPATVLARDALSLAGDPSLPSVDVAYIDPPYATHQYGSNYHLLTSVARWDRPPAPLELDERGVLRDKAGIRPDWIATRSAFCSRAMAEPAMSALIAAIRARFVLVSYSSEGIIPLGRLLDICGSRGSIRLLTDEHTKYPGGKQSSRRRHRNMEVVLIVDTSRPASPRARGVAERALEQQKTALLFALRFVRSRLEERFELVEGGRALRAWAEAPSLLIPVRADGSLERPEWLGRLETGELLSLRERLEKCACTDAGEELEELVRIARAGQARGAALGRLMTGALRRLGHRKYRERFDQWLHELRSLERELPDSLGALGPALDRMEAQISKRLRG